MWLFIIIYADAGLKYINAGRLLPPEEKPELSETTELEQIGHEGGYLMTKIT